jgi:hypothetical protein
VIGALESATGVLSSTRCPDPYGYLVNVGRNKWFPACCGRRLCPQANANRARRLRQRLQTVAWKAMVTVTLEGAGDPSLENQKRLTKGLRGLMQWVRRHSRGGTAAAAARHSYVWIKECGESTGRLHAHLLWTMPFLPQSELSKAAARCGLGAVLDVRSTYSLNGRGGFRSGPVGYITKYLTKAVGSGLPRNSRRYQTSNVTRYQPELGWLWRPSYLLAKLNQRSGLSYWLLGDQYLPVHSIPKTTTASRSPPGDDGGVGIPVDVADGNPALHHAECDECARHR